MPLISQFYGILIYIYKEIGGHHNEPHIHIKYNEFEMSMNLNGKILEGKLPKKQMKLVEAWYELHQDELRASFYSYNENGEIIKIKGLE
ncbi:MAG: DUF4160 domain-containing protein [Clostridia bacterium]|nr:DUF4160 domain-containing protein [Clostridia bacterium]